MRRSQYTSKFSAVLLNSLLAVAFGSASQSARNLPDPVHGILPARAEKEPHETGGDLLSHVRSSGAASPKFEPVDADDAVSLRSHALQFGPYADVNFPNQIPLPRYFPGYFNKHKYAAVREAEPKHVDPADSQVKPPESGRRKRSTDSSMKDNKGDNGDLPLADEPGAKVHCWNEADIFDFILPASEVAKHFPHECQHPLTCNTTCVAKVPRRDVCASLKSGCTEPTLHAVAETLLVTAESGNKQLASFEKNVERRLGELYAKLSELSSEHSYHKDKLVELGHNLSAASIKTLNSLDRKAAEIEALFNEKTKSMLTAISSVFSWTQSNRKSHLWILKEYAAYKAKAIKSNWSWTMSEKVYLRRYLISWGIYFVSSNGGATLKLLFQLHKGTYDDFIEWPLANELKLSIIHPETREELHGQRKPYTSGSVKKCFYRPFGVSNEWMHFDITFESSDIERDGYVKEDQLHLRLEMLS